MAQQQSMRGGVAAAFCNTGAAEEQGGSTHKAQCTLQVIGDTYRICTCLDPFQCMLPAAKCSCFMANTTPKLDVRLCAVAVGRAGKAYAAPDMEQQW